MTQIWLSVVFEECLHLLHTRRICEFINIADTFESSLEGTDGVKNEL